MVKMLMNDQVPILKVPSPFYPETSLCTESGFGCGACGIVFVLEKDLLEHNPKVTKDFRCPLCLINFQTFKGMRQHYGKKHAKLRPFRCNICYKRFRNLYASRIHKQQVHLHKARQNCLHCGKSVYNRYSLKRHLGICNKKVSSEVEV